jgi:hypothetical protein
MQEIKGLDETALSVQSVVYAHVLDIKIQGGAC